MNLKSRGEEDKSSSSQFKLKIRRYISRRWMG